MEEINVGKLVADLTIQDNTDAAMAKARKAMDAIAGELKRLDKDYKTLGLSTGDYMMAVHQLNAAQDKLASAMRSAFSNSVVKGDPLGVLNAKLSESRRGFGHAAQGMMQLGYIADDLQYGLSSVVNNIGPLVAGLGLGMGVAGAVQIAAVGTNILYENWDRIKASFGDTSGIEKARESIEGMAKSIGTLSETIDTAGAWRQLFDPTVDSIQAGDNERLRADTSKLDAMTRAEAAAKDMDKKSMSDDEKAAGERFKEIIKDAGGARGITQRMADAAIDEQGIEAFLDKSQKDIYADALVRSKDGGSEGVMASKTLNALREAAGKTADKKYRERLGAATFDENERKSLAWEMGGVFGLEQLGLNISSDMPSEKEMDAAEKKGRAARKEADADREKAAKSDAEMRKEWRKANNDLARILMPTLTDDARAAQDAIDMGGNADNERVSLTARLQGAGMSEDHAKEAARDAMAEQSRVDPVTRQKRRDSEAKKAQGERERAAREAVNLGKQLIPGISDITEDATLNAMANGGSITAVTAQIKDALRRRGMSEQDAGDAASSEVAQARQSLGEQITRKALDGREETMSQVLASSDLGRRAQAGVSSDPAKRDREKMIEELAGIRKGVESSVVMRVD